MTKQIVMTIIMYMHIDTVNCTCRFSKSTCFVWQVCNLIVKHGEIESQTKSNGVGG